MGNAYPILIDSFIKRWHAHVTRQPIRHYTHACIRASVPLVYDSTGSVCTTRSYRWQAVARRGGVRPCVVSVPAVQRARFRVRARVRARARARAFQR